MVKTKSIEDLHANILGDLAEIKEDFGKNIVVYLTGSTLLGLSNINSDRDYYIFKIAKKEDIFTKNLTQGKTVSGKNWEGKLFYSVQLYNLVKKVNPNVIEFFYKEPLYVAESLKPLSQYLYTNRMKLIKVDANNYIKSSLGMMVQTAKSATPERKYLGNGSFGKDMYNFAKVESYLAEVLNILGKSKDHNLGLDDDDINLESLIFNQSYLMDLKNLTKYDLGVYSEVVGDLEAKIGDVKAKLPNLNLTKNTKILEDIVKLTPVYLED